VDKSNGSCDKKHCDRGVQMVAVLAERDGLVPIDGDDGNVLGVLLLHLRYPTALMQIN